MSTLAIVLIVVVVVVAALVAGGFVIAARRSAAEEGAYAEHVAAADHALEAARAADRGWDRGVMEEAARAALAERHPGWSYAALDLVLVDDRPGVTEDRAEFEAGDGEGRVRIVLARQEGGWAAERVG